VEPRRSMRLKAQNEAHGASMCGGEAILFKEAQSRPDADQWMEAMKEELASLQSCGTRRSSKVPAGRNVASGALGPQNQAGCQWSGGEI
jgi:hypothetical protein